MNIKNFFGNSAYIEELKKQLKNEPGKLNLVLAEYKGKDGEGTLSDFKGIDIALSLDTKEAPVILTSFMPMEYFLKEQKFRDKFNALIGKKRFGYIQLPFLVEDILSLYKSLLVEDKEEDTLSIEIERINSYNKGMGIIQHNAQHKLHDQKVAQWAIGEARELGVVGTDQEIIEVIKNFKHESLRSYSFSERYFPGVFCDIEGTLIVDQEINQSMLKTLKEMGRTKPITLWTGGDVEKLEKKLLENKIFWKLVSKNNFAGAEVEIAFDDEEKSEFKQKYNIKVRDFRKI